MDVKKVMRTTGLVVGGITYASVFVVVNGVLRKVVPVPTKVLGKLLTGFGVAILVDGIASGVSDGVMKSWNEGIEIGTELVEKIAGE